MIVFVSVCVWSKASFDGEITTTIVFRPQKEIFNEIETQNVEQEEVLRDRFYGFAEHFQLEIYPKKKK